MALKKCIECSKEISDKTSSCPNCGCPKPFEEKIIENQDAKENIINDKTEVNESKEIPKKVKSKKLFWIISVLIIVAISSFVVYTNFIKQKTGVNTKVFNSAKMTDTENYKISYKTPKVKNLDVLNIAIIKNVNTKFTSKSNYKLGGLNYKTTFSIKNKTKKPIIIEVSHNYYGKTKYKGLKNYYTEAYSSSDEGYRDISNEYLLGYYPKRQIKTYSLKALEKKTFTIKDSINFTESSTEYEKYYQERRKRTLGGSLFGMFMSAATNQNMMGSNYVTATDHKYSNNDSTKSSYSELKQKLQNNFTVKLYNYILNDAHIKKQFKNAKSLDDKYKVIQNTSASKQNKLRKNLITNLMSETTKQEDLERFVAYEKEFRKKYTTITTKAVNEHYKIYKKMNTIEGYKFFIKHFSNYDIATVAITDMHDHGFTLARGINTKEGYDSYLSLFPYSNNNKEVSLLANEHEKREIKEELNPNWLKSLFTGEEDKRNKREVMARKLFISAKKNEKMGNVHVANRKYFIIMNNFNDTEAAYRVIDDEERKITSKLEQERFNIISKKLTSVSKDIKSQTKKLSRKLDTTISVLRDNRKVIKNALTNNTKLIKEQISLDKKFYDNQLKHMDEMKSQTKYLHDAKTEQDELQAKRLEKLLKK